MIEIKSAQAQPDSAGVMVIRPTADGWRLLVLRAYRTWDFPKGQIEQGESPLQAAIRETAEETGLTDLAFPWGEIHWQTAPYAPRHKIARYYLASTRQEHISLPLSPELGRPEHHGWRWVDLDEAARLLPDRLRPACAWLEKQLGGWNGPDEASR
ncbi:MAG: NUDIX domain-containing protein [Pseudomonadota bacterium]